MSFVAQARAEVELDAEKAGQKLVDLKKKAADVRHEMDKFKLANDDAGFNKKKTELDSLDKKIKTLQKSAFSVSQVLNNLSGSSLKDLQRAEASLSAVMRKETDRSSAAYKAAKADLQAIKGKIREIKDEMSGVNRETKSFFGRAADGFNRYAGVVTGFIATFTGVVLGFRKAINTFNEFESKGANLSALTGLVGQDIEDLKNKAKELSTSTTQDGVKITQSAGEIVDAFTLVGSAKPELLKDKEGLIEVTQATIYLAEASKMELGPAVDALTTAMNQYGVGADKATEFINVLAAGSKEGAAAVADISAAMVKFGPAATAANVSVEESVGLIETLAEKGVKGEIAGTGIKRFLLALQTGADETNPKVVGLTKAVENLQKQQLSATEIKKRFGDEGYIVAQILANESEKLNYYTKAVTDTNIAIEQAIINTATNSAALEQAKNRAENMAMALGEKLAPAFTFSTNSLSYLIKGSLYAIEVFLKYKGAIVVIATTLAAYYFAVKTATFWNTLFSKETYKNIVAVKLKKLAIEADIAVTNLWAAVTALATGNIKGATQAFRVFSATLMANPVGIFVGALALAISAVIMFRDKTKDAAKEQKNLNDELIRYDDIQKSGKSIEEKLAIIDKLSISQVEKLKESIQEQLRLEDNFNLQQKLLLQQRINNQKSAEQLQQELILERDDAKRAVLEQQLYYATNFGDQINAEYQKQINDEESRYQKSVSALNIYLAVIDQAMKNRKEQIINATTGLDTIRKIEEHISQLEELRKDAIINSPEFAALDREIEKWREKLDLAQKFYQLRAQDDISKMPSKSAAPLESSLPEPELVTDFLTPEMLRANAEAEYLQQKATETYEYKKALLEREFAQGKIGHTQYNEELDALNKESVEKIANHTAFFLQSGLEIMGAVNQMMMAQKEKELSQYKEGTMARRKAEKKWAKEQQDMALKMTLIEGALAQVTALTMKPWYVAMAASITAATKTIISLATIRAQQFYTGGFTRVIGNKDNRVYNATTRTEPGYVSSPTILTGERGPEYVVPEGGLQNPYISRFIQSVENARRSGRLRQFRYQDAVSSYDRVHVRQYADGGFTASQTANIPDFSDFAKAVNQFTGTVLQLQKGIPAYLEDRSLPELQSKMNDWNSYLNKLSS